MPAIGFAVIAGFPYAAGPHYAILMFSAMGFAIALTWAQPLLFGFTGLLTLGHAMFLATGAYAAAYLTSANILTFELILPTAAAVAHCCRGPGWAALHSLRQDLFQHADSGIQHAALLVSVQILSDYRRRRGAADQASGPAALRHFRARYS